jgi:uncharacterized protein (TIGR03437 family)
MKRFLPLIPVCFLALAVNAQTPAVSSGGIVNGASFAAGQPVAPGSLISIFGTQLAASTASADTIPLSTKMNGVTVTFNNKDAPLLAVTSGQINAQVPWEVLPGTAPGMVNVVVTRNGVPSLPQAVQINGAAPGAFVHATNSGKFYAFAVNFADNTLAWPTGTANISIKQHPVKAGDVLILYATGLGEVDPAVADGHNALDGKLHTPTAAPQVLVGNMPVKVLGSALSPQFVGVYQINIQLPSGVPTGNNVSLQIKSGGVTSPAANASIAVE